jgi:hypothetical protein
MNFTPGVDRTVERWALKLDFVGANPHARPQGQKATAASINYFKGPQAEWKAGLKTYRSLIYEDLWPGIDLVYAGTASQLKYTFLVKPGADPGQIKLAYRGATELKLSAAGQLEVAAPVGSFRDERPSSYQEVYGQRVEIATSYALEADRTAGAQNYGFRVGAYDRSKLLVIDPAVFIYSGYIGGSNNDPALKIAVDGAGNAYVVGLTSSQATFPKTVGPQVNYNGNFFDAYVAKVNSAGTALVYAGYIGGAGNEMGFSIAVDDSGNAYVTGSTTSPETSFPVLGGPRLNYRGGTFFGDAFVAKVRADGTGLAYCGYIGGSSDDFGLDIAVDSSGNAYITGETASSQLTFPVTAGPDLTFNGGVSDAFVAKVNATGTGLVYCGYLGGSNDESGAGIAVDGAGSAYVAGATTSTAASFPVLAGPDLSYNGNGDAFVAKVNFTGQGLVYCGYLGGAAKEAASSIALDSAGNAYLTGYTLSDQFSFPVRVGPDLSYNGGSDVFVAIVSDNGPALVYCGYIGGAGEDFGADIAVDSAGNAYLTGATTSNENTFPVRGGANLTYKGGSFFGDAFVAKVNTAGSALTLATYLGGAGEDGGFGIALDNLGYVYLTGGTESAETSFPVMLGPDLTYNSTQDGFSAKLVPIAFSTAKSCMPPAGGTGRLDVAVPGNYNWTAVSNDGFITLTSGGSGTGSRTVNYSVAANTSSTRRTGMLTLAQQTYLIQQGAQFNDVAANYLFFNFINQISAQGITLGCGNGNYCPEAAVTREQMAAFIIRALGEPAPPTPATQRFADVAPSNPFYAFIDRLAARGITLGCGNGNYCPAALVTREQMAALLIRALGEFHPPTPIQQRFADVPSSNTFYAFVERMAVLGITVGCGNNNYCPSDFVTRGQMAAFLARAFGCG